MRDGNCIQSDDAWGNNFRFVDVALPSPIDLRDALPLQLCTIYELVAEQTASLGRDRSHHTVGVKHLSSSSIHLDLCAYLNTRDEILMHNCIEKQACAHCVSCEKQIVTVDELRGDVCLQEVSEDRIDTRATIRSQYVSTCEENLWLGQAHRQTAQPLRVGLIC